MGGNESSLGNRKVTFELDEQERVRVLQGIRLSEDVVKRMKEPHQSKRDQQSTPLPCPSSSQVTEGESKLPTEVHPPTVDSLGRKPSEAEEDLYKRYEQEQAMVQEELLQLAKRERDAARERLNSILQQERSNTNEERQKTAQLPVDLEVWSQELQRKEEELKQRDAFYKEQLARIEQKNADIYKMTLEQYNEAITNAEDQIRRRNTQPVCANLQAEILKCYNENKHQVLNCSELVKEYRRCVSLAQKELLVHFD
ncbi:MICOS complex subunit MIC25 isoform X1 [Heteronotia binoei]|uniref:MICOS complex subunit MIC25 isoform X1 n=1 Tax=Heteronotia binoei TaxID=13085 RepID=UPI00292D8CCA|nr:MICOS complex subunit MIC25 isoform X1 [Heteronotia binoei]